MNTINTAFQSIQKTAEETYKVLCDAEVSDRRKISLITSALACGFAAFYGTASAIQAVFALASASFIPFAALSLHAAICYDIGLIAWNIHEISQSSVKTGLYTEAINKGGWSGETAIEMIIKDTLIVSNVCKLLKNHLSQQKK